MSRSIQVRSKVRSKAKERRRCVCHPKEKASTKVKGKDKAENGINSVLSEW